MKKGKRVNLDYVYTNVLIIVFMVLLAFFLFPYVCDFIGKYKFGLKWYTLNIQKQIYKKMFYRYILLEIVFLGLMIEFIIMYLTSRNAKVNRKLAKFIKNNFITYEVINKKRRIKDKADIRYILNKEYLTIDIFLHGSNFDSKLKDSREAIEDIFGTSISNMNMEFGKLSYQIAFKGVQRLEAISYIPQKILLDKSRTWDYDHNPHALIAGTTGSGKTYFVNYLICNLLYQNADLYFIDPKYADIKAIGEIINTDKTACEENQIAKLVREFAESMEERQKLLANSKKTNVIYRDLGMKPMFLIFDELAAFKSTAEKKLTNEIESYLKKIILMGRSTGNFVILIAQQPNATVVETAIRDQLGLKVALGNIKTELRNMMFGPDIKLHTLDSSLKGVGYISLANAEPYKYYAPNLGAKFDFMEEIKKLKMQKN